MEVKEAAGMAKTYLVDLLAGENIMNVGLEEVDFDERSNDWKITIGFSRTWDHNNSLVAMVGERRPTRSYRVVVINDQSGVVRSLKYRIVNDAA